MIDRENTAVVRQAYENFKSGNMPALFELMSPNIEWELPSIPNVPFSGKRYGLDGLRQFFSLLAEHQDVISFEPMEFVANANKVVALGHYSWKVKASGNRFESDWAHVFTIENGRIVRFKEYLDTGVAAAAYRKS